LSDGLGVLKQVENTRRGVLELPLKTNLEEGGALGATILAGVGVGFYDSVKSAVEDIVRIKDIHKPDRERCQQYNDYYKIYKKLYSHLNPVYKQTSRILKKVKNE